MEYILTIREVWEEIQEKYKQWIYLYIGKLIEGEYDGELLRALSLHLNYEEQKVFRFICNEAYFLKGELNEN